MSKIFLSYARADGHEAAARLRDNLHRARFTVWQDIHDLQGGEDWQEQLERILKRIDVVLVLLTPDAVTSEYVTWEWQRALNMHKRVIPLLILPCAVPDRLDGLHRRDLSEESTYTEVFSALVGDLNHIWSTIEQNLSDRLENTGFSMFHPLILILQRLASARQYPPEVFHAILHLFEQMYADSQHGIAIHDSFDQAIAGTYVQASSNIYDIFQSYSEVFHQLLDKLREELPGIRIPVVLVAMDADAAQGLADKTALADDPILQQHFEQVSAHLRDQGFPNWLQHYAPSPDGWYPFGNTSGAQTSPAFGRSSTSLIIPETSHDLHLLLI